MNRVPAGLFPSLLILFSLFAIGCTGSRTFHDHARAGDTVAVAAGWAHYLKRGDIEVNITDFAGTQTTYTPGSQSYDAVKASINFYPDPVSSIVISERIGKNLTPGTHNYSFLINSEVTDYDSDWWETVVFVDLPNPMALGDATIEIKDLNVPANETVTSIITIVPDETGVGTGGTPNAFEAKLGSFPFNMTEPHFQALERVPHNTVSFSGSTIPHAIQLDLSHNADEAHGGAGTPYVVNPIGHIKNLSWAQTGTSGTDIRIIITAAQDSGITNMHDFKFYVAGGITGLSLNGQVQAFDNSGNPVTGVSASISSN